MPEFERVLDNGLEKRLCQVELAINKFCADRSLVQLGFFFYRKCILKIKDFKLSVFVKPNETELFEDLSDLYRNVILYSLFHSLLKMATSL